MIAARSHVLLADPDPDVVDAALAALRWPEDAGADPGDRRVHLDDRRTAGAAVDALVRVGDAALAVVDDGLGGDEHGRRVQELLVRAARRSAARSAIAVLRRHVDHRDREVGLAVMRALATLGTTGAVTPADASGPIDRRGRPHRCRSCGTTSSMRRTRLRALVAFDDVPAATLRAAALRDELDLIRQRVLAAFSMRHGTDGFNRVVFQLAQRDARSHALALEWLDVTLTGTDRAAVAMLEPRLSDRERLSALARRFPLPQLEPPRVLLELVEDRDGRWRRPWVKACALYTASGMSATELDVISPPRSASLTAASIDEDDIVHETLRRISNRADSISSDVSRR